MLLPHFSKTPPVLLEALQHYLAELFPDRQFVMRKSNWAPGISRWYLYACVTSCTSDNDGITIYEDRVLGKPDQITVYTRIQLQTQLEFRADLKDSQSCDLVADLVRSTCDK